MDLIKETNTINRQQGVPKIIIDPLPSREMPQNVKSQYRNK